MILPTLMLVLAAVLALGLGFEAWRLTSSKGVRLNTFLGATGLAYAAYGAYHVQGASTAAVVAFFVAMLFAGRALGFALRSRKDANLKLPARLLFTVAVTALFGAAVTWCYR